MPKPKFKGWLASSTDPSVISNTVSGLVLGCSSLIILLAAQFFHLTLSASDVGSLATEVGVAAGAVWTVYGLIIKVLVYFGKVPAGT